MADTKSLQQRIEQLEDALRRLTGAVPAPSEKPEDRPDYVERGSAGHAALLGLKRATDEQLVENGWTLEDVTIFGPHVTQDYLKTILRQKVNELTAPMPIIQSTDPRKPGFAPTIWTPDNPLSRITET
jgi:hypothetical protein